MWTYQNGASENFTGPGQNFHQRIAVLDVDGVRVLVETWTLDDTPPQAWPMPSRSSSRSTSSSRQNRAAAVSSWLRPIRTSTDKVEATTFDATSMPTICLTGRCSEWRPGCSDSYAIALAVVALALTGVAAAADAGGLCRTHPIASASIWDPATGAATEIAPMTVPRVQHTGTLLRDGRVLLVGSHTHGEVDRTAEILQPVGFPDPQTR